MQFRIQHIIGKTYWQHRDRCHHHRDRWQLGPRVGLGLQGQLGLGLGQLGLGLGQLGLGLGQLGLGLGQLGLGL